MPKTLKTKFRNTFRLFAFCIIDGAQYEFNKNSLSHKHVGPKICISKNQNLCPHQSCRKYVKALSNTLYVVVFKVFLLFFAKKSVLVSHGVRFLRCTFQSRRYVVHIYINAIAKKPYSWSRYFKYSGFTIHFGVKWFMQSYFYDLKLSKTNVGNWSQCTFDDYFLFHQYTFISSMFDWCYTNLQVVKWK